MLCCVERGGVLCVSVLLAWVVQEGTFTIGWAVSVPLDDGLVRVDGQVYDPMTTPAGGMTVELVDTILRHVRLGSSLFSL